MKLKALKAKPKHDGSPTRGKENQEMGGSGSGNQKGPDTEFTATKSTLQTSDAPTIDSAKHIDIKAHTDPSISKMGGFFSSTGITLSSDTLIDHSASAGETRCSESVGQGKLTD